MGKLTTELANYPSVSAMHCENHCMQACQPVRWAPLVVVRYFPYLSKLKVRLASDWLEKMANTSIFVKGDFKLSSCAILRATKVWTLHGQCYIQMTKSSQKLIDKLLIGFESNLS